MCEKAIFINKGELVDMVSLKEEKNIENSTFVFKTNLPDKLLEFLKEKGITCEKNEDGDIIANFKKYGVKDVFKMLENSDIYIEEFYKQKQNLEKRFIKTMGGKLC